MTATRQPPEPSSATSPDSKSQVLPSVSVRFCVNNFIIKGVVAFFVATLFEVTLVELVLIHNYDTTLLNVLQICFEASGVHGGRSRF